MIPLKIFFSQWSSPSFRGSRLAALRRLIRSLEHGPGAALDQAKPLAFGDPAIDAPLGGGLMRGVLHELATKAPLATAPLGCVLALIARTTGPLVLVLHEPAATEDGAPYGPGLSAFGVAPERLIIARVRRPEQVLWAMEQAGAAALRARRGNRRDPRRHARGRSRGHAPARARRRQERGARVPRARGRGARRHRRRHPLDHHAGAEPRSARAGPGASRSAPRAQPFRPARRLVA
jgi:hypothetical protein